jgi:hypothetical protein
MRARLEAGGDKSLPEFLCWNVNATAREMMIIAISVKAFSSTG